jgi:hypothetical protein
MARNVVVMDWDEDAQRDAERSAREIAARDPEAASLLIQTLVVTQDAQEAKGVPVPRRPADYEPMKLYEFAAKEWGYRPKDIDEMHYLTFFALVREANERRKKENDSKGY